MPLYGHQLISQPVMEMIHWAFAFIFIYADCNVGNLGRLSRAGSHWNPTNEPHIDMQRFSSYFSMIGMDIFLFILMFRPEDV